MKKLLKILEILEIFKTLNIRDSSFAALQFYIISFKSIDRSFKTAPVAVIPVNPYFWSKHDVTLTAEHDVTLTSFVAEL